MNTTSRIVSFRTPVESSESAPAAEALIAGRPKHTTENLYTDAAETFFSGFWSSTRGKWRVHYTEHEFCHLLEGRIVITSESGERWEFNAGDSFVIPSGFSGTWEVLEDCRKLYVIYQPR
jgi:uncharacterized cupin superfamily protein